jgi:putative transposase
VSDKYALIAAEQATTERAPSATAMCEWLGVSRSGFYDWRQAQPSPRQLRRAKVTDHVRAAFDAGRGTYGVRRVHAMLTRSTDPDAASASIDLVRAIMREEGLAACQPRAYKVTTRQDPDADPISDRVNRDFTAETPGVKLVGDITYIKTWEGWLYLATVIDCCTKQVIGWSMAEHMRTDLICHAITMAATRHPPAAGAIFHSDRGSQYTSAQFAKHLAGLGLVGSMGRTGVCWDNAMAESFFAALKNELIYRVVLPNRKKARRMVAEYIEVFYNRNRIHSGLGYKTPHEVALEYQQNRSKAA